VQLTFRGDEEKMAEARDRYMYDRLFPREDAIEVDYVIAIFCVTLPHGMPDHCSADVDQTISG
jgi:hypothetical protein